MKYEIVVPGDGPIPCELMIISEAGGREEVKLGRPFVGRSGLLLNDALHKAGTHRDCVYITNCYKGNVGKGNRNPTFDELAEHRNLLNDEIFEVNPRKILLLGNVAFNTFVNGYPGKLSDVVGNYFDWMLVDRGRHIKLFPCFHPSYILRGQSLERINIFYSAVENFVKDS